MQLGALDKTVIERAAIAIYEFDENLTDDDARQAGRLLAQPRLSWEKLCETYAAVADVYRARARVALLAALGANQP